MPASDRPLEDEPVVTAVGVLAWRERAGLGKAAEVPARVLLLLDGSVFDALMGRRRFRSAHVAGGRFGVRSGGGGEATGILAIRGVGGPAIAVAVEELAALGAREFVLIGLAGGISGSVSGGSVVVLDMALPGDGISRAYGADDAPVSADAALTAEVEARLARAAIEHSRGSSRTTDAIYRETPRRLQAAVERGAGVVEMEAAGLFSVTAALGLAAAAVVVVADAISGTTWHPPVDLAAHTQSMIGVARAMLGP